MSKNNYQSEISNQNSGGCQRSDNDSNNGVKLKKELSLLNGVAMVVGIIIGSGIFVSPKGVLNYSGSIGQALVIWILSGILSMIGALCYAELGTMNPKSGGDYAYINDAFGPLLAFLYLWVSLFILVPTANAITALTFSQYILQPLWPTLVCGIPSLATKLIAALTICILTFINCYNVKLVTRVQDVFTVMKILALLIIIIAGILHLLQGNTEYFRHPFKNTYTEPGYIALAAYNGLYSYSGWNYLNFVTEEIQNPFKNLPRAVYISMPLVTLIYVLTNIAYFAVLTPKEILNSNAVAVTFGNEMLGAFELLIPLFVAFSTFGSLNGSIFASARVFFVGARDGLLPKAIALINVKSLTPVPSLVFMCIISIMLVLVEDIYVLINYVTFVEAIFTTISISSLLWMRYTSPNRHRPIRINITLPITFFIVCVFLVTFPCYVRPWEVIAAISLILTGIPIYYLFIKCDNKPRWLLKSSYQFNDICARFFICSLEQKQY